MQTKILVLNQGNNEESVHGSEGGLLHVLPQQVVWTAKQYGKQATATVAVVSLVARPTTTAAISLHNPASSGVVLVIERVFTHFLVTDPTELGSLWLCSHPVGQTAPSGNDITIRNSTGGLAAGGSASIFDINESVSDDGWFPWGDAVFTPLDGTGIPGGAQVAEVNGRIVVPEGAGLSAHVVSSTITNDFVSGMHWFEVPVNELVLG